MKKNISYIIFAVAVVFYILTAISIPSRKEFVSNDKDRLLIELISHVIQRGHFNVKSLNDDMSEQIFHTYLESIDGQKRYFLQSDFREFAKYMYQIDNQLRELDLTFFDLTYQRLILRMNEVENLYKSLLASPFDFQKKESFDLDYEEQLFPLSQTSRAEKWRKQLKLSTLSVLYDKVQEAEKKEDSTADHGATSWGVLEEEARTTTRENMEDFFDLMNELERKDWFDIYLNAFVLQFDPHTNYFNPDDKDRFDMNMSGKFEGIGARLSKRDQAIKVVDIIVGGPLWRDQLVEVGDEIQLVRQEEGDAVDIRSIRLDDAIKLIKGPKGSTVHLTIKKVDGTIETIPVKRDLVVLEESYARSTVINRLDQKYGLINLPKFYVDFKSYKERNAAHDVEQEVINLKEAGVKGLIIDLRNNGGGSLQEAYELFGLFIPRGPVVQIQSAGGRTDVRGDRDPDISWEGPMAVLVNRLSASASEIFAGAVQDYGRGLVIGSQTFGKGTVQALLPVNEGQLKLTIAKFYRISGQSTQHQGVIPDIQFPSAFDPKEIGESALDTALPWDQIRSLRYRPLDTPRARVTQLIDRHQARIASDPNFKALLKRTERTLELRSKTGTSLHLQTRIQEREDNNQAVLDIENMRRTELGLPEIESIVELERDTNDADPQDDASLMESARILLDDIQINPRLAGL